MLVNQPLCLISFTVSFFQEIMILLGFNYGTFVNLHVHAVVMHTVHSNTRNAVVLLTLNGAPRQLGCNDSPFILNQNYSQQRVTSTAIAQCL